MKTLMSRLLLVFGLACVSFSSPAQTVSDPGDPGENRSSIALATKFLQLIDKGQKSETWPLTGPLLQGMVTRTSWIAGLESMRLPLGKLKARTVDAAAFTAVIDGAPDGHYYVVFFTSQFERAKVEEKVILNLSKGEWDVEGYFITPIPAASP
ncbi:MAG: DUF4019 domain-containing protein [Arenimonas sp.]